MSSVAAPWFLNTNSATIRRTILAAHLPVACCAVMLYTSFSAVRILHGYPPVALFLTSSASILGALYLNRKNFEAAAAVRNLAETYSLKIVMCCLAMLSVHLMNVVGVPVSSSYTAMKWPEIISKSTFVLWSPWMGVTVATVAFVLGYYLLFLMPLAEEERQPANGLPAGAEIKAP